MLILSQIILGISILFFSHSSIDFVFIIASCILVMSEFSIESKINVPIIFQKLMRHLRTLALGMYFSHTFLIRLFIIQSEKYINKISVLQLYLIYVIFLVILSEILCLLVKSFKIIINRKRVVL